MTKHRPTIADAAREAGVSVPTVSKVLNGRADVAPGTRARVEAALAASRYKRRTPMPASRSAPLLELVIHQADSAWAQEIIKGVDRVCGPARVGLVLSQFGGSHRPSQGWIEDVVARRPLGVILVLSGLDDSQRAQLASRSIPFVIVDTDGEQPPGVPTVGSNNWNGGLTATRHLIGLGHTRIAVISGPADVLCSRARVDGYRTAHDEVGLQREPQLVRWGAFTADTGYEEAKHLLTLRIPPTAIFAGSDHQALGVIRAAYELGLRVPDDLSIVGYDNLPITQWLEPRLTTINQPLSEMAELAARTLLALARGTAAGPARVELATELVVRESTAPPGATGG